MQETGRQASRRCQGQGAGRCLCLGVQLEKGVGFRALAMGGGQAQRFFRLRHYPFTAAPQAYHPAWFE